MRRGEVSRMPVGTTVGEMGGGLNATEQRSGFWPRLLLPYDSLLSMLNQRTSAQRLLAGSLFDVEQPSSLLPSDSSTSSAAWPPPSKAFFQGVSSWPRQAFDVQRMRANVRDLAARAWPDVFLKIPVKYAHRHHLKACEVIQLLRKMAAESKEPAAPPEAPAKVPEASLTAELLVASTRAFKRQISKLAATAKAIPKAPTGAIPKAPTGAIPKAPTGAIPKTPTGSIPKAPTGAIPKTGALLSGAIPKMAAAAVTWHQRPASRVKGHHHHRGHAAVPLPPPAISFSDASEKKLACELAFSVLKYESILNEVLSECSFFRRFPELLKEQDLVLSMLFDLQERRFRPSSLMPGEKAVAMVAVVEQTVTAMRVKLQAAMARLRIKHDAPTLRHLLPQHVRDMDSLQAALPIYAWVNRCKASLSQVLQALHQAGFVIVTEESNLKSNCYLTDTDCSDLLRFHPSQRSELPSSPLVQTGLLIIQEKSTCVGPQSFSKAVQDNLLGGDILHTHVGSGRTTAHLASLLRSTPECPRKIFTFGAGQRCGQLQEYFHNLGMEQVVVFADDFKKMNPHDLRFEDVTAIFVNPPCSNSTIVNPVDFVCSEDVDMNILNSVLDKDHGIQMAQKLYAEQVHILEHALSLPKVYIALYQTYSWLDKENQMVVDASLQSTNLRYKESLHRHREKDRIHTEKPPDELFLLEPVPSVASEPNVEDPFICIKPSVNGSGCFIAMLKRTEKVKLSARAIIDEAEAKGLLAGLQDRASREEELLGSSSRNRQVIKLPKRLQRVAEPTHAFLQKQSCKKEGPSINSLVVGTSPPNQTPMDYSSYATVPKCPRHSRHHQDPSTEMNAQENSQWRFVANPVNKNMLKLRMPVKNKPRAPQVTKRDSNLFSMMTSSLAASVANQIFHRDTDKEGKRKPYPLHTLNLDGDDVFDDM